MDNLLNQFSTSFDNLTGILEGWVATTVSMLPNIVLAALVMIFSIFAARYVRKYLVRVISRFSGQATINRLLASMGTAVFMMLMLFIVLGILNLDTALKSLLAGAGVAGLAIGLALQEPLINLFSGIMMSVRQYINLNDLVETNGLMGIVQKISLRSTVIKTFQGQEVIMPNKLVYQNPLKNYSSSGERRVDIACGISYGDDLEKVEKVAVRAIEQNVDYDESRAVELLYTEFGNSSINFVLRFWIDQCRQPDFMRAQSEAIKAIKRAFDQNDITIPFPIRTLDFGIKGGEKLGEAIPESMLAPMTENRHEN